MDDATGLAEALLGLDGFGVVEVRETPDEVATTVETTADLAGCPRCEVRAVAKSAGVSTSATCPASGIQTQFEIRPPSFRPCPRWGH